MSSKSRKLSVFDRLGPEEDLSHVSFHFSISKCNFLSRDTRDHLQAQAGMQVTQDTSENASPRQSM